MSTSSCIKIGIISASNLKQSCINSAGFYVQFSYRDTIYRTQTSPSTAPNWNEQFTIQYNSGKDKPFLRFEFHEISKEGQDIYAGKSDIAINSLKENMVSTGKYFIDCQKVGTSSGVFQLRLTLQSSGPNTVLQAPSQVQVNSSNLQPNQPLLSPQGNISSPSHIVMDIMTILPQVPRTKIEETLKSFNGDKEKALAKLLDDEISKPIPTQTISAQQQSQVQYPTLGSASTLQDYHRVGSNTFAQIQATEQTSWNPQKLGITRAPVYQSPTASVSSMHMHSGQGRMKSLLIGINYYGTPKALQGCVADVNRMRNLLINYYRFPSFPEAMVVLTDESIDQKFRPIKKNIICAMKWLVQDVRPGDVFVFFFSGHGTQVRDYTGMEKDGYDEAILPEDYERNGVIRDNDLHNILVAQLPNNVRLTAILDCCHSGTGMDLPFEWSATEGKWKEDAYPYYSLGDVQLFSGCADSQYCADLAMAKAKTAGGGALTTAFVSALMNNPFACSYPFLLEKLQEGLQRRGIRNQHPQLSSTQKFPINRQFNFTDIMPNSNKFIGRQYPKKYSKRYYKL